MGKKKFKKKFIVIPLICAIAVGGIAYAIYAKKQADSIIKVVSVSEISDQMYVGEIYSYGKVTKGSMQSVRTSSDSEIKVSKYNVKKGDTVKKGDVLVEYDIESLQMNLETQKTELSITENNIKICENKLKTLKDLQPSENATQPQKPEREKEPTPEPTEPPQEEPIEYLKKVDIDTEPSDGDGSEESPYVFFVSADSVINSRYMKFLSKGNNAIFNVCTDDEGLVYSWLVNGSDITKEYIKDWSPVNGVSKAEDGSIRVKQSENPFATLITYIPDSTQEDGYSEYIENGDMYEMLSEDLSIDDEFLSKYLENNDISDYIQSSTVDEDTENPPVEGADYFYSKEELDELISDTESQLEELKFNKRQAEIEIKKAENSLKTGKEVATIDGVVTFSALSNEQAVKTGYHVIISNEATTSLNCTLRSRDLKSVFVGTGVNVSYYGSSENKGVAETESVECGGTVTEISDTPTADIGEIINLDSSDDTEEYYEAKVVLDKSIQADENEEIFITFDTTDVQNNGVWLRMSFIRNENGKSYVLVANDDNILEKRYIEQGVTLWGSNVEVLSGLSEDDRIAFPYGNAKEGMPTVDSDLDSLNGYSIF